MGWGDDLSDRWGQLQQKIQDDKDQREQQYQSSLQPGDETAPADTFGNTVQNTLGLPDSWRQTIAQQKHQAVQPQSVEAGSGALVEMGAAPEAEAGELAVQGAEKLTPELKAWAQKMMGNPNAPVQVNGPINMNSFQKLRDALGHVGPVIMKGGG